MKGLKIETFTYDSDTEKIVNKWIEKHDVKGISILFHNYTSDELLVLYKPTKGDK